MFLCYFLFLPEYPFFVTLLVTVHAFLPILLFSVTLFNDMSIPFAVRTGLVYLYLCTISTLVPISTTFAALSLDMTYV